MFAVADPSRSFFVKVVEPYPDPSSLGRVPENPAPIWSQAWLNVFSLPVVDPILMGSPLEVGALQWFGKQQLADITHIGL